MTLADLFDQHGIPYLPSYKIGAYFQIDCPFCGGGTSRERKSLHVKIDADEQGFTYHCKRGTCVKSTATGAHLPRERAQTTARSKRAGPFSTAEPAPEPLEALDYRPDWFWEFFDGRGIGSRTVKKFRCWAVERHTFRGKDGKYYDDRAIAFPYFYHGKLVRIKYRSLTMKGFSQNKIEGTLFNGDSLAGAQTCAVVEGELDAMTLDESINDPSVAVVSIPSAGDLSCFQPHENELMAIGRFLIANDMDVAGAKDREELARRLGKHKTRWVRWPDGCKDANDTAQAIAHGRIDANSILDFLDYPVAEVFPVEGVYVPPLSIYDELDAEPEPPVLGLGIPALERQIHLPGDGRITVLTGYAGYGKSAFIRHVIAHQCRNHGRKFLLFAAEDRRRRIMQDLAALYHDIPYWSLLREQKREAAAFWHEHIRLIHGVPVGVDVTLDWLIKTAEQAVLVHGVTDVVIDPWNEVEHEKRGLHDHEYIGESMRQCNQFTQRHGCNLIVVVHPTKPPPDKRTSPAAPGAYDVAGSSNWANKCDLGLTIHQDKDGNPELHLWKTKDTKLFGRKGKHKLFFDEATGKFRDPIPADVPPDASSDDQEPPRWAN